MRSRTYKRLAAFVMTLILIVPLLALTAFGGKVMIRETVNVAAARQNMHGHGYEWDNRKSILTLDNILIDTESDYGLRLPGDCTVILNGANNIRAGKYGISCAGNVVFKGNGSLYIEAGEIGIYLISQDNTTKVKINSGRFSVKAGKYGVYSEYSDFAMANGEFSVDMTGEEARAVFGRVVSFVGGSVSANASLTATHSLTVDAVNIDVASTEPALQAKNLNLRFLFYPNAKETYDGENEIHAKAMKRWHATSILFGENVDGIVDYLVLAVVLLALAACILIPMAVRRKKKKELYARLVREGYLTEQEANERR